MNARERKAFGEYVRWCADAFGLRNWTFHVKYDVDIEDDEYGRCEPTFGRKVANLYFHSDLPEMDRDVLRHTVIHELLHCHHAQVQEFMRTDMVKHFSQAAYDLMFSAFVTMHEYAIDGVASAIDRHFPLIQWPEKTKGRGKGK